MPFGRSEAFFLTYTKPGVLGIGGSLGSIGDELGAVSGSFITEKGNKTEASSVLLEDGGAFIGVSPSLTETPPMRDGVKKYKVRKGDTFSGVAAQFGITLETLRTSNASVTTLKVGQELTILPVSGTLK